MIDAVRAGRNIAIYPEGGCKGRRLWDKFLFGAFTASLETGTPIVPVFLHYEAQEAFEWLPSETLIQKLRKILTARNRHANYYVFDAIDPAKFSNREEYSAHVYALYQGWQRRYLE
jgi:1-acyl-sn-glycerol-3-phosphate acyltransferase